MLELACHSGWIFRRKPLQTFVGLTVDPGLVCAAGGGWGEALSGHAQHFQGSWAELSCYISYSILATSGPQGGSAINLALEL